MEDIYGSNDEEETDLKIRPRFVDENFRSRHTQFVIQNEWEMQKFLQITGIRVNFCLSVIYEGAGHSEVIQRESMHLQTENYTILPESNIDEIYENAVAP